MIYFELYSLSVLSFGKKYILLCKVEMLWRFEVLFIGTTEMASYLSPSRGDSRLSPVTVVGIARHCGRILRQARALCRLRNSVKACFPHWCTLPHTGAPLLLSALHTAAATAVQSVHLPHEQKNY